MYGVSLTTLPNSTVRSVSSLVSAHSSIQGFRLSSWSLLA